VVAPPDTHALCYEVHAKVPAHASDAGMNECWVPVAFAAFGVANCGAKAMPWLPAYNSAHTSSPFLPASACSPRFDVASLDRLVVLSEWRGSGAKEVLLAVSVTGRSFDRPVCLAPRRHPGIWNTCNSR